MERDNIIFTFVSNFVNINIKYNLMFLCIEMEIVFVIYSTKRIKGSLM